MARQETQMANPVMVNAQMRAMLLQTGIPQEKNLGTFTETALGRTTRIKLFNVGVTTKLLLDVTAAITIATTVGVASAKAPYNLISRIRVNDYDGADRVNVSGFQLFFMNCMRARHFIGYANSSASAVYTNPKVPTAVATDNIQFQLEIPLAYDVTNPVIQLRDLRGAMMMQTAVGEAYLTIDWASTLLTAGDVDAVYTSGTAITLAAAGIQCTVFQSFIMPQAVGENQMVPLPQIDLMTVYMLDGYLRSSDNLAVGQDKLISYPNLRQVIRTYLSYVQATTMTQGKIDYLRILANGSNLLIDRTERVQLFEQRKLLDGDFIAGSYCIDHSAKPIETALYGNVQLVIRPNTVGAAPYCEIGYEHFFTKGQALPGVLNS